MASSKLMTSSSTSKNSDLITRKYNHRTTTNNSPRLSNTPINNNNSGQMTVDGLLRNVYSDNEELATEGSTLLDAEITLLDDAAGVVTPITDNEAPTPTIRRQESVRTSNSGQKTVDDVWKEIVDGRSCKQEAPDEMMTLEDFLAMAGAVEEEDVKVAPPPPLPTATLSGGMFAFDNPIPPNVDGVVGFGIGVEEIGGRWKRRAMLEPLDKAAQKRQRRMIKNRESAARSRERKQAYQVELESLAVKLEEENELFLKEKAEQSKERFKQKFLTKEENLCMLNEQFNCSSLHSSNLSGVNSLPAGPFSRRTNVDIFLKDQLSKLMEKIIPVLEKRRPPRVLRKVRSMQW